MKCGCGWTFVKVFGMIPLEMKWFSWKSNASIALTELLPCPRLRFRVLTVCRKKLLLLGSKGLTRDYLPYISTVWGIWRNSCTSSAKSYLKAYCCKLGICLSSSSLQCLLKQKESEVEIKAILFFVILSDSKEIKSREHDMINSKDAMLISLKLRLKITKFKRKLANYK